MSDEVISIEEIIAYSLETYPGVIEDTNWESDRSSIIRSAGFRRAPTSSPSRRETVLTTPPPGSVPVTTD